MSEPFWRAFKENVRMPVQYCPGTPMITMYDDGAGYRPVTEIEWAMWRAFWRFDAILQEANGKFDQVLRKDSRNINV